MTHKNNDICHLHHELNFLEFLLDMETERKTGRSILGPFKLLVFSGRMATKVRQIQEIPFLRGHLQFWTDASFTPSLAFTRHFLPLHVAGLACFFCFFH